MLKQRRLKHQFYSEPEIWEMGRQLLHALKYLHSKNIVHRDFKTLNIFIGERDNLLVGDLGVSKIVGNDDVALYSRVGTPLYLAPEIIKYDKYDYKADIWGFGCVMYVIAALTHPFEGKNIVQLGHNIVYSDPKPLPRYSP
jgi:NIMA (never in mitosis gene a)-related kinase